jgi:hypothetical protein
MEAPRLPNGRHTVGIDPIVNRTYEGELDVRLQQELRRRLFRDAGIRVWPIEQSDLVLTLELSTLAYNRARDINRSDVSSVSLSLAGVMTVRDAGTGQLLFNRAPVGASAALELPQAAVETPAVRDDAIDEVVGAFADAVIERLLLNF